MRREGEDAAREVDKARPVVGFVRGVDFLGFARGAVGLGLGFIGVGVHAAAIDGAGAGDEAFLEFFGLLAEVLRRSPAGLDLVRDGVYALVVALGGEFGDLGEEGDAAAGEAEEAVDLVDFFVVAVDEPKAAAVLEVGAEEGLFVAIGEAAEDVEVGEPAREEEDGFVASAVCFLSEVVKTAFGDDHLPCHLQVLLPGYADRECMWRDDLQRGQHDGCCERCK